MTRREERAGLLIALAGLGIAVVSLTSRTASAATPGGGGGPYAPDGPTATPTPTPGTPVTYGTFAGPVRGDATIWRAQRMLEALGYSPGIDDGLWGNNTRRALNAFQGDYGQQVTSTLTSGALANLENEYARIAPPGAVGDLASSGGRRRYRY